MSAYYGGTNNIAVRADVLGSVGPFVERYRGSDTINLFVVDGRTPKRYWQQMEASANLTESAECHCLLFRTRVLKHVPVFDDALNTREFVDVCLALRHGKVPFVFEPKSQVTFVHPPPVHPDEREYYFYKWDLEERYRQWRRTDIAAEFVYNARWKGISTRNGEASAHAMSPTRVKFLTFQTGRRNGQIQSLAAELRAQNARLTRASRERRIPS